MTALRNQPDDPGIEVDEASPLIFGGDTAELTPNTIKTIRRNAGRVAPFQIAEALRWSFKRLQRVARANGIDLRYPPASEEEAEPRGALTHRWSESSRDPHRTVRICERCGMLKISRHEFEGGKEMHWQEFYRGTERVGANKTPACEPVGVDA